MKVIERTRIDKYLWAIRVFKTRSQATDACVGGKVKINGNNVKPSRPVTGGEEIHIQKGQNKKIYKVLQVIDKRVGFKEASLCYEDLSPPEIKEHKEYAAFYKYPSRKKGEGRPTKKDRRNLDQFRGE